MNWKRLLVPVDFSDDSAAALDSAAELASDLGAQVHLLHACAVSTSAGGGVPVDLEQRVREASGARLEEWRQRLVDRGVEAEAHLRTGDPSQAIRELADEIDADLIVIGRRGQSRLLDVMLGSVAERTLRTAPCPVLAVKHPA